MFPGGSHHLSTPGPRRLYLPPRTIPRNLAESLYLPSPNFHPALYGAGVMAVVDRGVQAMAHALTYVGDQPKLALPSGADQ